MFGKEILEKLAEEGIKIPLVRQFSYHEEKFEYSKDKIPLGLTSYGELVNINFSEAQRLMVLGGTGSGKTYLLLSIVSRYLQNEENLFLDPCDVKNEMANIDQPVQKRFRKYLLENEKPQGFKIKVYRPVFFDRLLGTTYSKQTPCQIKLEDLDAHDFSFILGLDQERVVEAIVDIYEQMEDEQDFTVDRLKSLINGDTIISPIQKRRILRIIDTLLKYKFIGEDYGGIDIVRDLNEGFSPIINFQGIDTVSQRFRNFSTIFVDLVLRRLVRAKQKRELPIEKKILIKLDESELWYPNIGNPPSKRTITNILNIGRDYRISMCFIVKNKDRIPKDAFRQCRYIFFPQSIQATEAKEVIKEVLPSTYENPQTFLGNVTSIISGMSSYSGGQRDWMVFDRYGESYEIFRPLAPLCHKKEEGKF